MSSLLENMKRTTRAQLDAYNKWDLDAIMTPRADDCVYRYLPESMNRPPMNNEQFREYFASILPLLQGFDVCPLRVSLHPSAWLTPAGHHVPRGV